MVETVVIDNVSAAPEDQEVKKAPKVDLEKFKLVLQTWLFTSNSSKSSFSELKFNHFFEKTKQVEKEKEETVDGEIRVAAMGKLYDFDIILNTSKN